MSDVNLTIEPGEPEVTVTETPPPSDNEVVIAAIEAEAAVAIAEIEANARVSTEESYNETRVAIAENETSEIEQCQMEISRLSLLVEKLADKVETMTTAQLSLVSSPPIVEVIPDQAAIPENDLTPTFISPETDETLTEVTPVSGAERVVEAVALAPAKPILRLV